MYRSELGFRLGSEHLVWKDMLATENITPEFGEYMEKIISQYSEIKAFDDGFYLHELSLSDYILKIFPQYSVRIHEHCIFQPQGSVKKEITNMLNSCIKLRQIIASVVLISEENISDDENIFCSIFNSRFDYVASTQDEDKAYERNYHGVQDSFLDQLDLTNSFSKVKASRAWDYNQGSKRANTILNQLRKRSLEGKMSDADRDNLMKRIQIDILISEAHKDKTGKNGVFFLHSLHRRLLAMEEYLKAEIKENGAKRGRRADPYTADFLVGLHAAFCREFNTNQMNKDFFALVRMLLDSLQKNLETDYKKNLRVSLANKQDSSIRRMINSQKEKNRKTEGVYKIPPPINADVTETQKADADWLANLSKPWKFY